MFQVRKSAIRLKNKKGGRDWYARIRWTGADGRQHNKHRRAQSKAHAKTLADQLAGRFAAGGVDAMDAEKMTFAELAEAYAKAKLIKARRAVGEVVASDRQLLAVLERQIKAIFNPAGIVNERDLCETMRCDQSWLWQQRKEGCWLNFEVDQRGRRFYTPEQILANMRGEKLAMKKVA